MAVHSYLTVVPPPIEPTTREAASDAFDDGIRRRVAACNTALDVLRTQLAPMEAMEPDAWPAVLSVISGAINQLDQCQGAYSYVSPPGD